MGKEFLSYSSSLPNQRRSAESYVFASTSARSALLMAT